MLDFIAGIHLKMQKRKIIVAICANFIHRAYLHIYHFDTFFFSHFTRFSNCSPHSFVCWRQFSEPLLIG